MKNVVKVCLIISLNVYGGFAQNNSYKREKEVFLAMQEYSSSTLLGNIVNPYELILNSLLYGNTTDSLLRTHNFLGDIIIDDNDIKELAKSLNKLNNSYWKPPYYNKEKLAFKKKDLASISKPVFYGDNYAFLIGYYINEASMQQVFLLEKKEDEWAVINKLNVGIYLKYSSK